MAKRPTGRKGQGTREPFIMIEKRLLEAEAWKDLRPTSMVIYLYLKKQKTNADCKEDIRLPYRDPENLFSTRTFSLAIDDLITHGFIELEDHGKLYRRPNVYRLSDKWEDWDRDKPYDPKSKPPKE